MSYEPTLVISKKDLDKHKKLIVDGDWQYEDNSKEPKGEDGLTVMEYLKDVYKTHKVIKVKKVEMVLCSPCFTSFNALVRKKLDELGVEYAEDN